MHSLPDPPTEPAPSRRHSIADLIESHALLTVLEPIVDTTTARCRGHAALVRGAMAGLPSGPDALFALAATEGMATRLAERVRERAVQVVGDSVAQRLFLGSHPAEYACLPRLVASLGRLRERAPDLLVVLEVPEAAHLTPDALRWLRNELSYLAVEVAYRGLGAGPLPLAALAEAPPDYLKVDETLVGRLHRASVQTLLEGLVGIARGLGTRVLAEGLVATDEVSSCRRLGIELCQGPASLFFPSAVVPAGREPTLRLLPAATPGAGSGAAPRALGEARAEALRAAVRRFAAAASGP